MSSCVLEREAPKRVRRRVPWMGVAVVLVLAVALVSTEAYLSWANHVPPLPPEVRTYPNPNGLDRLLAATRSVPNFGRQDPLWDPLSTKPAVLRTALISYEDTLQKLRASLALPFLNPPIRTTDHPPQYSDVFPRVGRLLVAKSQTELAQGRAASAMSWALDAVEFGGRAGRGAPAFIHQQGRECSSMGAAMAERCIPALTDTEATAAARRLDRVTAQFPTLPEIMAEEHRFRVAARHRVLTGADPAWVGGRAPSAYAMWEAKTRIFLSPKPAILSALDEDYAALEAWSHKSWLERRQTTVPCEKIYRQLADRIGDACAINDAQLQLVRLELSLYACKRRTGSFPESLDELPSVSALAFRRDPFSEQPFRYQRIENGFRLYSYGPDMLDQGGDPQMDVVAGSLRSLE